MTLHTTSNTRTALEHVHANPGTTGRHIRRRLDCSWLAARRLTYRLASRGLVRREGGAGSLPSRLYITERGLAALTRRPT